MLRLGLLRLGLGLWLELAHLLVRRAREQLRREQR